VLSDYNTFDCHPWHSAGQGVVDAALHYIILLDTLINAYHVLIQPWVISDPTMTLLILKNLKSID